MVVGILSYRFYAWLYCKHFSLLLLPLFIAEGKLFMIKTASDEHGTKGAELGTKGSELGTKGTTLGSKGTEHGTPVTKYATTVTESSTTSTEPAISANFSLPLATQLGKA